MLTHSWILSRPPSREELVGRIREKVEGTAYLQYRRNLSLKGEERFRRSTHLILYRLTVLLLLCAKINSFGVKVLLWCIAIHPRAVWERQILKSVDIPSGYISQYICILLSRTMRGYLSYVLGLTDKCGILLSMTLVPG